MADKNLTGLSAGTLASTSLLYGVIGGNSRKFAVSALDTYLGISHPSAGIFQLGAADANPPISQTLSVQSGAGANVAGANFTIAGSKSTGSAAGGSIIFQTAAAGGAGSGQNALATALTINSLKEIVVNNTGVGGTINFGSNASGIDGNTGAVGLYVNSQQVLWASNSVDIRLGANVAFGFSSANGANSAGLDTILVRDAANTLALRNSTNKQKAKFNYSYTDGSNESFATIDLTTANTLIFGTAGAGTGAGVLTKFQLNVDGVNKLDYGVTTAATWTSPVGINVTGIISASSDIFSSSGDIYVGGTHALYFNGRTVIKSAANGTLTLSTANEAAFTALLLGPSGTAYPRLAPTGTAGVLKFRLADDSGDSAITAAGVTASGALINTGITSDATHTDSTVCQDTTTHQFYAGSGAVGICLGTSSLRFKTDVAPLNVGLADLTRLQAVSYRYRPGYGTSDRDLYGFTAEQVATVLPQLVGNDIEGRPNSVDWAGLVPVIVNAMKEQQEMIEDLRKELRATRH